MNGKSESSNRDRERHKKKRKPQFIADPTNKSKAKKKNKSRFMCQPQYHTSLPEPHFHMKMLRYPHPEDRLTRYCASYMDLKRKLDVTPDFMLGVPIDLINVDRYESEAHMEVPEEDSQLFDPEETPGKAKKKNAAPISWLRRQDILANNLYDKTNKHISKAETEAIKIEKARKAREARKKAQTREGQIKDIVKSFTNSSSELKHPMKPHLKVKSVVDLYPGENFGLAKYTWVKMNRVKNIQETIKSEELLLSCLSHETHVSYKKPEDEEVKNVFKWDRELTRTASAMDKGENHFFIMLGDDTATYYRYHKKLALREREHGKQLERELEDRHQTLRLEPGGGSSEVGDDGDDDGEDTLG
mmetsp:Transcript_32929/g.61249  ORF Transcript_32929/g.61249 Transcript_32929/m.61249 type:complete len:359 (-) Transcript_32929:150-1226(-)|eukprot:CAMPEP_0170182734 /NCGR_PEP_ID=MMETSP0040_2-20121228/28722_1 /TAXON_ID=641309 /ORGANISM="Lotharella oceanica, Strain CCMP622" /LENGTH=358 /DNA_ID=CAMNT_0010428261 /DNA_START=72 /DNA_END=1148 /DNA_ORIENTATION=+